jgi:uncharacterized membrane protein YedE/YeeE
MKILQLPRWSPYAAGAAIGVLSWVTFAVMGKPLGTSTSVVAAAGALEAAVAPEHVAENAYFQKMLGTAAKPKPLIDWQFALVLMLALGAFAAARLSGLRFRESVPELWRWRFGDSKVKRWLGAFAGGAILLFGARMADGCTSGHGISGGLQLALSSWVFLLAMFASGTATAWLLYGKEGRNHVG